MTPLKKLVTLALLPLLFAFNQAHARDTTSQIEAIMEQSGFNKLVNYVPHFAQITLKQSSGALDPQVNSALSEIFEKAFDKALVRKDVIAVIRAHYDADHAENYIALLNTPQAQKAAELERAASDIANRDDYNRYVDSLSKTPAPKSLTSLVERLDQANRATDFSVDMQTAFFKAVFTAVDPVMNADMRLRDGELDKMAKEVHGSLEKSVKERTQLTYLYAFHSFNEKQLETYVQQCESEHNRWAVQLLSNAMISAINKAADRAALMMAQNNQ